MVAAACRASAGDLELALGHPLQANAYLTPPGAAGLAPHHDTHDVFVLQVAGAKHWVVRQPVLSCPLAHHQSDPRAGRGAARDVRDRPARRATRSTCPRGFVHSATTQQGTSLHLTLGVLATTVHDVLRRMIDRAAADDIAFRAGLPAGFPFDHDVAARTVKAALSDLIGWLERLDPGDVADELRRAVLSPGALRCSTASSPSSWHSTGSTTQPWCAAARPRADRTRP